MPFMDFLHFSRPTWLFLIPLVLIFAWGLRQQHKQQHALQHFIDPKLVGFLTHQQTSKPFAAWLCIGSSVLLIIGLAGISWEKTAQPTFNSPQRTILLIDQSLSMYATDVRPNRLTHLKQKVRDTLSKINEGEIAMVAYAGDAYTISPFSKDKSTLTHFLLALDPLIMPLYGSNLDQGMATALSLLDDISHPAHIILFTDDIKPTEVASIVNQLDSRPIKMDIIGIGTTLGGTIVLPDGQQLKDSNGPVKPALPINRLKALAQQTAGQYYDSQLTEQDLQRIVTPDLTSIGTLEKSAALSNLWVEKGHWFALPFLFWLLFKFRLGAMMLLLISLSFHSNDSFASPLEWFLTDDQKAQKQVQQGNWQAAANLFTQPKWQAAASYALEEYTTAAEALNAIAQTPQDYYNLANSLALSGQTAPAIEAYKQALAMQPDFQEAKENLSYLEQQQDKQKQQDKQNQQDSQETQSQDDDGKQGSQKNDQQQASKPNDPQKSDQPQPTEEQPQDTSSETAKPNAEENLTDEQKIALDQWLRQIQDDPGGLLQRKLWYLHQEKRAENRFMQEDGLAIW